MERLKSWRSDQGNESGREDDGSWTQRRLLHVLCGGVSSDNFWRGLVSALVRYKRFLFRQFSNVIFTPIFSAFVIRIRLNEVCDMLIPHSEDMQKMLSPTGKERLLYDVRIAHPRINHQPC